jgi:acetyltransferase
VRLSQMIIDLEELVELDINPLLADHTGVRALDARIGVQPRKGLPRQRMAIRPYPAELEHTSELQNGEKFFLRAIRAEDADALRDMLQRCSAHDVRMRFLGPVKQLDHTFAARLSQINYHREMALIAQPMTADGKHTEEVCGAIWLMADPDNVAAEYAVMVRTDLKGHGIGHQLMVEMLKYAKKRGLKRVVGDVLRENTTMLDMAKKLGFKADYESSIEAVRVAIELAELSDAMLQAQ